MAIVVALLAEFVAGPAAIAALLIGFLAILRIYFEVGGPVRKRRKRKPGPGRSRRPRNGDTPS